MRRFGASATGAVLLVTCLSQIVGSPVGRAATAMGWETVSGPGSGQGWTLRDVAVVATDDVWAVGVRGGSDGTLADHWTGSSWTATATQDPDTNGDQLRGVAAADITHVWAVGNGVGMSGATPLIERWDGSDWSLDTAPGEGTLYGVGTLSSTDMWAVGSDRDGHTLIERGDGSSWSLQTSADPSTNEILSAVAPISASDVWAVGRSDDGTLLEHWNGSTWTASSVGPGSLTGIAAFATDDIWAVGGGLAVHWDGSTWTAATLPVPSGGSVRLSDVSGSGSEDVWAVGTSVGPTDETLIEHWDGSDWSIVPSPNPTAPPDGEESLAGVAVASTSDVWAVGSDAYLGNTLIVRYGEGEFTSTLRASAPSMITLGDPSGMYGDLSFSGGASPAGRTIHLTRTNPDTSITDLGNVATTWYGHYEPSDTPAAKGTYTYTATFDGDDTFPAATSTTQLAVVGKPVQLTIAASTHHVVVGGRLMLRVQLSVHQAGRTVWVYRQLAGRAWTKVASGTVGPTGAASIPMRPPFTARYQARFAGDATYAAAASGITRVAVAAIVEVRALGGYATKGGYRLYHFSNACATSHHRGCPMIAVAVQPDRPGARVTIFLSALTHGAWEVVGTTKARLGPASTAGVLFFYDDGSVQDRSFQIHAEFRDARNAFGMSRSVRFRITS